MDPSSHADFSEPASSEPEPANSNAPEPANSSAPAGPSRSPSGRLRPRERWAGPRLPGPSAVPLGLVISAFLLSFCCLPGAFKVGGSVSATPPGPNRSGQISGAMIAILLPGILAAIAVGRAGNEVDREGGPERRRLVAGLALLPAAVTGISALGVFGVIKPPSLRAPPPTRPVAQVEAQTLGQRLADDLVKGRGSYLGTRVNAPRLAARALEGQDVPWPVYKALELQLQQSCGTMGQTLHTSLAALPGVRLDVFKAKGGKEGIAILRMVAPRAEGLNYFVFVFEQGPDGPQIVDFVNSGMGFSLSQQLKGLYRVQQKLQHLDPARHMAKISQRVQARQFREALAAWDRIPPKLKGEREFVLMRRAIAYELNDADLIAESGKAVEGVLPANVGYFALALFDIHYEQGDWQKVLDDVDRLESAIGGDPLLDALRARPTFYLGEREQALKLCARAVESEPELDYPLLFQRSVAAEAGDLETALAAHQKLVERFEVSALIDPASDPALEDLASFAGYRAWLRERAERR